ncbi:MAG: EamA/RhaT family transporter, partial [Bacteroidia bacterium]|nr:EamA/RhaT family transporter [Bacteroidia bacterium]
MSSLLLSIISSALLAISFKVLDILKINSFQAIVTNYFVAATIGYLTSPIIININSIAYQSWFGLAFMLGFVFIFILSIIAVTTQKMGITVAGVANKMSIVIPVSVAIIFYKDSVTIFKIIGLLTAIIAVILTSKKKNTSVEKKINKADYIFPLLIFIGSGFIDSSINYAQRMYLTQETFSIFLSVIFCSAGSVGIILLVYRYLIKKESLQIKAITAGI